MVENEEEIATLLQQFHEETRSLNSLSGIEKIPSSIAMVAMGEQVVHYIFQKNIPMSFNLMVLLKAITGFKPPEATLEEMKEDWLNWASRNHHL